MLNHPSFWSAFEEPADPVDSMHFSVRTKTATREEPDEQSAGLMAGTHTMTETAEENDQDPHHIGFSAVPPQTIALVRTQTRTREEPDQDLACGTRSVFVARSLAE